MNKPKISVIVPVYKVEQYLRKCVDSILGQTYANLEIILVDDGSPDTCGAICDEYAEHDNRVKVIHKENGGVSSARNAGIDAATGDYIGFVDSDDWIEPTMYEKLLRVAQEQNAEAATCTTALHKGSDVFYGEMRTSSPSESSSRLLQNSFRRAGRRNDIDVQGIWCKLYKKSVLSCISFREGMKIGEDLLFWLQSCCYFETCAICDEPLYHLIFREESAYAKQLLIKKAEGDWAAIQAILPFAAQHAEIFPYAVEHLIAVAFIYLDAAAKEKEFGTFMAVRKEVEKYHSTIRTHFHSYSVKYRLGLLLLRFAPHIFYLLTLYRMTHGKWKGVT